MKLKIIQNHAKKIRKYSWKIIVGVQNSLLYNNLRGWLKVERIVNKAKARCSINKSPIQIIIGIVDERLVKQ